MRPSASASENARGANRLHSVRVYVLLFPLRKGARGLGILGLVCTALYAYPRTSVLGAILLTGYLGGAVATHLRVGSPVFSHMLFGIYLGIMLWGGLYLRDDRLRALIPYRR